MKRLWARTLSALALGWAAGSATVATALADPPSFPPPLPEPTIVTTTTDEQNKTPASTPLSTPMSTPASTAISTQANGPVSSVVDAPVYVSSGEGNGESCGHGHGHGGLSGGAGLYVLKPSFRANPAFSIRNAAGTRQSNFDFDWDYEIAPQFWVGYTGASGLGVRGSFWFFDHTTRSAAVNDGTLVIQSAAPLGLSDVSAQAGDQVAAQHRLRFEVWDLEVTQTLGNNSIWAGLLSAGIRYVHIAQDYRFTDSNTNAGGIPDVVNYGHNFHGFGPTAAFQARRSLGVYGLGVYGTARGSLLWGSAREDGANSQAGAVPIQSSASRDEFLTIGELELGLEWNKTFRRYQFFAQGGAVGQIWWGAGNASNNGQFPNNGTPSPNNDIDMGLFGIAFRAGIRY